MNERTVAFWERVLSEIDDGGFFECSMPYPSRPATRNSGGSTTCAQRYVPNRRDEAAGRPDWMPVLFSHPDSGITVTEALAVDEPELPGWRVLLGTDLEQALLPSLLPILIAMLMPIAVIILLLMR
jgi:hypothetical protein